MAINLSATNAFPYIYRATLAGVAGDATRGDLPPGVEIVSVHFLVNNGAIAFTGTDGATIDSQFATIPTGTWMSVQMHGRATGQALTQIFLAADQAGPTFELLLEEVG